MGSEYTPLYRFLYTPITATQMHSQVSETLTNFNSAGFSALSNTKVNYLVYKLIFDTWMLSL